MMTLNKSRKPSTIDEVIYQLHLEQQEAQRNEVHEPQEVVKMNLNDDTLKLFRNLESSWYSTMEDTGRGEDLIHLSDKLSVYFTYENEDQTYQFFRIEATLIYDGKNLLGGNSTIELGRLYHNLSIDDDAFSELRKRMIDGYITATEDIFDKLNTILEVGSNEINKVLAKYTYKTYE